MNILGVEIKYPKYNLGEELYIIDRQYYGNNCSDKYVITKVQVSEIINRAKETKKLDGTVNYDAYQEYRLSDGKLLSKDNLIRYDYLDEEAVKAELKVLLQKDLVEAQKEFEYYQTELQSLKQQLMEIG